MTTNTTLLRRADLLSVTAHLGPGHIYSVKEVACLYYPQLTPLRASRRFRSMMRLDEELMQLLRSRGFREHQRLLSPAMLALIVEHLGPPIQAIKS